MPSVRSTSGGHPVSLSLSLGFGEQCVFVCPFFSSLGGGGGGGGRPDQFSSICRKDTGDWIEEEEGMTTLQGAAPTERAVIPRSLEG